MSPFRAHGAGLRAVIMALALAVLSIAAALPAAAHETTASFARIDRDGDTVDTRLRLAFRDIEVIVWMDEDLDGSLTWGEVRARREAIDTYVRASYTLAAGGSCDMALREMRPSEAAGVAYLDLDYAATCPDGAAPLKVSSRLLAEIDPDHRHFVDLGTGPAAGGQSRTAVLTASRPSVTWDAATDAEAGGSAWASFASYFVSGSEHLLGGPDHLIFLLVLMLPAVTRGANRRAAALGVLAAVTGFTVGHALTLTAGALQMVRPHPGIVEILIAVSIVVTAIDNVRPFLPGPRSAVAAVFGLVHGFGFATMLGVLELDGGALALALLGFNLGIEVAQVVVVAVALPLLYFLAKGRGRGRWTVWIGSGLAGIVGCIWVVERLLPVLPGGLAG